MKFSTIYRIYPGNKFLEHAIAETIELFGEEVLGSAAPDNQITVSDNFLFMRGNFEQHLFSANVIAPACEMLEAWLGEQDCNQNSLVWARAKNNLGNLLASLGQQQRDVAIFARAVACFNDTLEKQSQEACPAEWAETQYNLATVNQALGRLLDDPKLFKAAVDAYTNALQVWTREGSPENWMFTMLQLGDTFHSYGKLLKGNRTFQKSVVAYKNALSVLNADDYALELTAAHNNRAVALHHLAESEQNPHRLEEAIRSYEKAYTVSMEQQLPVHLSTVCRVNKLTARNVLADSNNDAVLAEEVADEFEVVIECFPHALQPLCLKHCEEQLEIARCSGNVAQ
ncbi:MAG TPA: tetratricopeptide repeat protein [Gammaproteobacteria bacterium]|nr:tetratricopeptide repeat protein [Gammaproteobacteria bacterium]